MFWFFFFFFFLSDKIRSRSVLQDHGVPDLVLTHLGLLCLDVSVLSVWALGMNGTSQFCVVGRCDLTVD